MHNYIVYYMFYTQLHGFKRLCLFNIDDNNHLFEHSLKNIYQIKIFFYNYNSVLKIRTQLYGFKYFFYIQIICTMLFGLK